jgi:hypothetical protein
MTMATIGVLLALAAYLGKRWNDSNNENVALRAQVAALKRRIALR